MRIKAKVWAAVLLFVAALLLTGAFSLLRFLVLAETPDRSGWSTQDGVVCYLNQNGQPILGWQKIDGHQYYFLPDGGEMATGLQTVDGKNYYMGQDGRLAIGLQAVGESLYYFGDDGVMLIGWQTVGGAQYCFSETGAALTGWHTLDGQRYYFTQEGKTLSGWQTVEEKRYYFTDAGHTLSGWVEIEGILCRFDADGTPLTGWFEDKTGKYFFDEKGCPRTGWQDVDGKRYYFDQNGVMTTGWLTVEQDRYYFREDGTMAVGEVKIDGVSHFFTSKGKYVLITNRWNPVPQDYVLDLVPIGNYQIDRSARDALETMIKDCQAAGFSCSINNTYRSRDLQQYLWNRTVNKYMAQGMSYEKACEETGKDTMLPGHSEHQTGLAVDLDGSKAAYAWLAERCWDYGFILRYPEDCIEITGIIYEPWHFRYVGTELSQELKELGLCMEEYMTMLTQQNG